MKILKQVRKPVINHPVATRRQMWRMPFIRSYLVVFIAYMCMYLIRKNFNVSQNDLIEHYGLTKTDLGTIGFWFAICYGIGKTVVGYMGDGKNTKNFVSILLILSACAMLAFGAVLGSLSGMIFFFALNGFFQSAGGPLSYSTITKWTSQKTRGTFLGLWNMSHNVGGALAAIVATFGAEKLFNGDVRGMFIFPACIALLVGVIGLFTGNDSPEAYGLGPAEEIFEEELSTEDLDAEKFAMDKWSTFKKYILKNPYIWGLCFANVFVYIVRIGVDQWGIVYAKEVLGLSKEVAKSGFTMFEVGALSGALIWGISSDLAKGRRALVSMVALFLILIVLGIYQHAQNAETYRWSMFALGFLIFGPQLLIGVSGVGFVPKNAVGVADGFRGTFGYLLGDSFAKLGLGMMADNKTVLGMTGWNGTFTAMYGATVLGLVFLAFVAFGEEKKIRKLKH
jgi:OPA family hexose phosphate transport protein UhpT-like MFS transporter